MLPCRLKSSMAAATDTFIESKFPSMGIFIFDFDSFLQNELNPVALYQQPQQWV